MINSNEIKDKRNLKKFRLKKSHKKNTMNKVKELKPIN